MGAYCRICFEEKKKIRSDVYVTCNNCGSLVCSEHYRFWDTSKNAFCTSCFPRMGGNAIDKVIDALDILSVESWRQVALLEPLVLIIVQDTELKSLLGVEDSDVLETIKTIMNRLAQLIKAYESGKANYQ